MPEKTYTAMQDNAGFIHLSDGETAFAIGYDHTEIDRLEEDMAAWIAGEWEPCEENGQTLYPVEEYDESWDRTDFKDVTPARFKD